MARAPLIVSSVSRRKIIDEFSNLPVSRQRKAQLRAVKRGLCACCFKRKAVNGERCEPCDAKRAKRAAKWYRQRRKQAGA
jgi:hypothetical protein